MRRAAILATTIVLAISPAHAQNDIDGQNRDAPTTCQELIDGLRGLIEANADSIVEATANGCRMTNIYIVAQLPSRFRVTELTLEAPGLFEDIPTHIFPAEAELTLKGIVLSPDTGSLLHTYIIESQAQPIDLHVAYSWDREAGEIRLADFSVSASDYGSFRLAARVSNVLFDPAHLQDPARYHEPAPFNASFDELALEIDNAGFIGGLLTPALLGSLPYDQDPRPIVASSIAGATAFIKALPKDNISEESKAALITLISGFPRPSGDYKMELRAQPGIALGELMVDNPLALAGLLGRITITAHHETGISQP